MHIGVFDADGQRVRPNVFVDEGRQRDAVSWGIHPSSLFGWSFPDDDFGRCRCHKECLLITVHHGSTAVWWDCWTGRFYDDYGRKYSSNGGLGETEVEVEVSRGLADRIQWMRSSRHTPRQWRFSSNHGQRIANQTGLRANNKLDPNRMDRTRHDWRQGPLLSHPESCDIRRFWESRQIGPTTQEVLRYWGFYNRT